MIKVSLSQDSMFQMAMSALTITNSQLQTMKQRFMNAARAAESHAQFMARTKLHRTAQEYSDALSYNQISEGMAELRLDASASHLENGYGAFDMKAGMLASTAIVKTGKRAGQPWVRVSKEGYRYAIVPFSHTQAPAKPGHPLNQAPVQIGQPNQTTMGNMASDLKKLAGMTKGMPDGKFVNSGNMWAFLSGTGQFKEKEIPGIHPNLQGLQKSTVVSPKGKNVTQYNTFRVVSENPNAKAKWRHPGFAGVHIFKDLESWMRGEMEKIVRQTLGGQ